MNVFDYHDYKNFVNNWIKEQPKEGYGQLKKLSEFLNINSVVMSQVFRGNRDLSMEQAVGVAKFIGLTELGTEYFLLLLQKARAGSHELKNILEKQLGKIREESQVLKNRVKHQKFGDEEKATFYSQWYYSAIRLGISIEGLNSALAIADYLKLDRSLVSKVLDFLLKNRLIVEKNGKLDMGPQVTHIGHDSPYVSRHHTNWRLRSLQAIENIKADELFYSGPMALSQKAANEIRKDLISLIEKSTERAVYSKSEKLSCLCIDWFKI